MSDSPFPEPTPRAATVSDRPPSRPPGRDSSAHLHAALSASGKAEASLSTLMRSIRDLSAGVSGAREANVQLLRELEAMSDLLGAANERQLALKNRVTLLEQSLQRAHIEAQRERSYILDQQDSFIAAMMEDHEQVVNELHREIDALRNRPSQRPTSMTGEVLGEALPDTDASVREELEAARKLIDKLVGDRERTRETLLKVQAQRDEAQAALVDISRDARPSQPRISDAMQKALPVTSPSQALSRSAPTLPPPQAAARASATPQAPPVSVPLPAVLTGIPLDGASRPSSPYMIRPKAPELSLSPRDFPDPHMAQAPEELRAALHPPSSSSGAFTEVERHTPPGPPSVAPATATPTPSGRPGGYSLTNSVAPEHVSGAPRASRAPRR
jgi:hypothetical protein